MYRKLSFWKKLKAYKLDSNIYVLALLIVSVIASVIVYMVPAVQRLEFAPDLALACATSASPWASALLSPAIKVVRATPVVSFILLVWLWVARAAVPGVISALMVLPVVWGNVSRGVAQTDPQLLELAKG